MTPSILKKILGRKKDKGTGDTPKRQSIRFTQEVQTIPSPKHSSHPSVEEDSTDGAAKVVAGIPKQVGATTQELDPGPEKKLLSEKEDGKEADLSEDKQPFREHSESNEFDPEVKRCFHNYEDTIRRYKKQLSVNSGDTGGSFDKGDE
eukprot:GFUD01035128.1.p1 GENE.GFUD01035128.1~~GFUD01035128.1.p1  ORF type:complete len:148 (-),score=44.04 GFUD01035128.1:77-520(-)